MPYITQERRDVILYEDGQLECAGELNFMITGLILAYVQRKGLSYQTLNDVTGALENCKLEAYRRLIAPLEDRKILENGDVYPEAGV